MLARSTNKISTTNLLSVAALVLFVLAFGFINSGNAQTRVSPVKKFQPSAKATQIPGWQGYKNVKIGMVAAEVKKTLGNPQMEDKDGFFYTFSETETARVLFDGEQKVRVILVIFDGLNPNPPKFEDVLGKEVAAEPRPDGALYKMIKYADAGYWIAYNRSAGEKAMVMVTIQKL